MKQKSIYRAISTLTLITIMLTACGGSSATETNSAISTAVAQTVQAQQAQITPTETQSVPPPATATLGNLVFQPTLLPTFTPNAPTSSASGNTNPGCLKAELISETIPDGTIFSPGEVFTKTWTLKNTGSCAWDTSFKIVYYGGNTLGGAFYYNLPLYTAPGGTQDISLVLKAPAEYDDYKSEWKLQSSNGTVFGVGQYNEAFYADISVVNKLTQTPDYRVTNVKFNIVREPTAGCATTVHYNYIADVSTNGPIEIKYGFKQSDGTIQWKGDLKFTSATTQTATGRWSFHLGSTPGEKWVQFVVLKPYYQEFDVNYFSYLCGNTP